MAYFDRFDICEAWSCLEHDYGQSELNRVRTRVVPCKHTGYNPCRDCGALNDEIDEVGEKDEPRPVWRSLERCRFKPRPSLKTDNLSDNAFEIYCRAAVALGLVKADEQRRRECEDAVRGPGKFEGEEAYAYHFYDDMLNGDGEDTYSDGDDPENGDASIEYTSFEITPEDCATFPELLGRGQRIHFTETSTGFWCECEVTA